MRKLWLALILVTSLSTFCLPSQARGKGGQDAGGGNVFEIEFKATGSLLSKQIHDAQLSDSQLGFSWGQFDAATREVRVVATNETISLNGDSKSAINSSNQRIIVFNSQVWTLLNLDQKRMIVLHEYLRFTGVDDAEYAFTLRTLELLKSPVSQEPDREKTYKIVGADLQAFSSHTYNLRFENGVSGDLSCGWSSYSGKNLTEYTNLNLKLPNPHKPGSFKKLHLSQALPNKTCQFLNLIAFASPQDPVYLIVKGDGTFSFIK